MTFKKNIISDAAFFLLALAFVACSYLGNQDLTPDGVGLDSDLQAYVQILDYLDNPAPLANDPLSASFVNFPALSNFMISMSSLFDGVAYVRILKAGAISVFLYLALFYLLGRFLYRKPSMAALLAILMSVTVNWAFGTFWGATHSDPVPRILAAAMFPALLMLALKAERSLALRCLVLFLCGGCVCLHSVTGVTYGAMFFMAFLVSGERLSPRKLGELGLSAVVFLIPALFFLKRMRLPMNTTDPGELSVLHQIWDFRFAKDYGDMVGNLLHTLTIYTIAKPIFLAAIACAVLLYLKRHDLTQRTRLLLRYLAGFLLGVLVVIAFVCVEMNASEILGRNQMSNELLRGTRFLVPIALLLIVTLVAQVDRKIPVAPLLAAVLTIGVLTFSMDKQILAARHYVAGLTGLEFVETEKGARIVRKSAAKREALLELSRVAPAGSLVFTDTNDLEVRYVSHLPLVPTKKDGDKIYYNNDVAAGKGWLSLMSKMYGTPARPLEAWEESGAAFYLSNSRDCQGAAASAELLYSKDFWSVCRKRYQTRSTRHASFHPSDFPLARKSAIRAGIHTY